LQALLGAVLDLRSTGFSEGVAYDGYVLDFVADWLGTLPVSERSVILDNPNLNHYLEQSYLLGAPGNVVQVAQLGDVEPVEMPFHLSAQAKLLRMQQQPVRSWLIAQCPVDALPASGLAALRDSADTRSGMPPAAGALDAHYAAVLRSGWQAEDLAVAVSCSDSPMGHIQADSGSLVIGTRGRWLVADPGYQQYVRGDEREFTIGPRAHNAPQVNGHVPSRKRPRRTLLEDIGPGVHRVAVDLTSCYPAEASVTQLVRHVWLSGRDLVVVADQFEVAKPTRADYCWHGDSAAAWWFENGWALITLGEARLWLACSQGQLGGECLQRLPGSRGHMSLVFTADAIAPVIWWVWCLSWQSSVPACRSRARDGRFECWIRHSVCKRGLQVSGNRQSRACTGT
jgi:hypothetical protein